MPGFDRTGPERQGSQTGRGLGKCNPGKGNDKSVDAAEQKPGLGMRRGDGRGMARGFRAGEGKGFGRGRGNGPGRGAGRNSL
ncbi:MAG: DUF5320 domain-containing protein [Bacteroidales bacterium]|nr:DUF5320 domain-containing protein [Bacteroidales bacterium]MBN2819943.1 DUF5320 domain-containing protein [Bacteroidales bacterium]